jgi:serine/threonine protein phosphatase 1
MMDQKPYEQKVDRIAREIELERIRMSGRLVAIGDIHGHHTELMALYQQLLDDGFDPQEDTIIGLGDATDGGPDTKKVLDQLISWQEAYPHWIFLKENHEDLMLDALVWNSRKYGSWDLWYGQGGKRTALSYLPEEATDYERAIMQPTDYIDPKHIEWIQSLPLKYEHPRYYFVHAGFRPAVLIDQQSEQDMLWIREGFYNQRYNFGKPVIFGHTPVPEPMIIRDYRQGHRDEIAAIGIDTMVGDYGKLTAVELDTDNPQSEPRFYFQPAEKGKFEEFDGFR